MIRTLLIIAAAGLVLAIAGLGGAAAVGGTQLKRDGWAWDISEGPGDSLRIRRSVSLDVDEDSVSRTLAWSGSDSLRLDAPVDVVFVQGAEARAIATGPASAVDRLRLEDGRLFVADAVEGETVALGLTGWSHGDGVRVVVTAPSVRRFELRGAQNLRIRDYDQPTLALSLSGSGEIEAAGRTDALTLNIAGSGEADLAALSTGDAAVAIAGSGEARIAPVGQARIDISGSGDVVLTTRPAHLSSNVSGSGRVRQQP